MVIFAILLIIIVVESCHNMRRCMRNMGRGMRGDFLYLTSFKRAMVTKSGKSSSANSQHEDVTINRLKISGSGGLSATQQSAPDHTVSFVMPPARSTKTPKLTSFSSYAELVSCVRTLHTSFEYADLFIQSGFVDIEDELSFSSLDSSKNHPLYVESLSVPFHRYTHLASVEKYAGIYFLPGDRQLTDSFPAIRHGASFKKNCDRAVDWLILQKDGYSLCSNDLVNADFITTLWIHTVAMANNEIKRQSTGRSTCTDMLRYEYNTAIHGTRAHGKLNRSISIGAFVLGLHQTNDIHTPGNKHIYSTLAQMVAAREQTLRHYVERYQSDGITESQIKEVLDAFPSVGVISCGTVWIFLLYKYDSEEKRWHASHSPWHPLYFSSSSVDTKKKADLRPYVEDILTKLVGATLMQWQHHVAVEAKLQELVKKDV